MSSEAVSGRMTERLTPGEIERAAEWLRAGGTVAFPTETVYGLGANTFDPVAVAKIFEAKQRPAWDPLIVHICSQTMLAQVTEISDAAGLGIEKLASAFWPGPLTLLLPRSSAIPDAVTAGRPLVGVRMPRHSLALQLIAAAGVPLAAPSANRFGHTSPTTAAHVLDDLDGRIDAVLDGGPSAVGIESTIFDPAACTIYRPGAVTPAMIAEVIGREVRIYKAPPLQAAAESRVAAGSQAAAESQPAPGTALRHYAPRAQLTLVPDEEELQERISRLLTLGERVGVMLPVGWASPPGAVVFSWAGWKSADELARTVFFGLRELDATGVTTIVCPLPQALGVGVALRDRLEKAARRG